MSFSPFGVSVFYHRYACRWITSTPGGQAQAVVTGIQVDDEADTVLVQVSANLDRLFPSVVPAVAHLAHPQGCGQRGGEGESQKVYEVKA